MHRNIKPSNILFHDDSPKLADFGICKDLDQPGGIAQSRMFVCPYSSPQIVKGGVYDSRADLWSLGIILYEMLYGKCPFSQNQINAFGQKNSEEKKVKFPYQNDGISGYTKNIIIKLLAIKYRERMNPSDFIKYGLTCGSGQSTVQAGKNKLGFKYIALFVRRSVGYVAQTLYDLAQFSHSSVYLILSFMVFKIFYSIQFDVKKNSAYWKALNMINTQDKWDFVIQREIDAISGYGDMVKQALIRTNISQKVKMQIQTRYISDKYFLQLINVVLFDTKLKNRLINCFLINKHFVNLIQIRICNFTDYTISDLTMEEKIQLCQKHIRYI